MSILYHNRPLCETRSARWLIRLDSMHNRDFYVWLSTLATQHHLKDAKSNSNKEHRDWSELVKKVLKESLLLNCGPPKIENIAIHRRFGTNLS